ncbi:hypothetical protein [Entomohabitans teleogrylli]|uniref:hypothetical protein n=1 Tax=Entomohabitans teleogrylli TaxID=1384589 RepID=UPI00073D2E4B|nr:hypothetical protein [Entomohabitans teleogrylli]
MPIDRNRYVKFVLVPDLSNTRQSVIPQPDIPIKSGFFLLTESGYPLLTEADVGLVPERDHDG